MAAAIDGNFVVTSPNQDVIWHTPREAVYLRSDRRYGPNDPTLLPQPYIHEYPYLGAIPSKPMNPDDPLSIMWWNPTRDDFISSSGGVMAGIGKLSRAGYECFLNMRKQLEQRIRSYCANNTQRNYLHDLLLLLERDMLNASTHVSGLQMTFAEMMFDVTEFQRCYLEISGLLDYLEIYKPRMDGKLGSATSTAKCVGAMTYKPLIVQQFFTAGLPIWFIQPLRPGPFPQNVLKVVTIFERAHFVCIDNADPPFPVIYTGPLDVLEKHKALHQFSRKWLVLKNPFQHEQSPTSQASTSTRASTSSASRISRPQGPDCKYFPFFALVFSNYPSPSFESTSPT
jgi:hypothetical protein